MESVGARSSRLSRLRSWSGPEARTLHSPRSTNRTSSGSRRCRSRANEPSTGTSTLRFPISPWPPFPVAQAARPGAAQLPPQIQIATANAIDRANPLSSNSLREAGVAHLFRGQSNAAIRQLNAAATLSGTAGAWSDLAVAYIAECEARSDLGFCVDALACTDRAIAADESYPPARFNRALALQKLGFVAQASEEWRRSERTERDVRWAAEAARRRGDLPAQTPEWSSVAAELESAAATGDHSAMMRLIRVVPRDARSRGESVYLASWGEAFLAGKESEARRNLVIAREIGRALERNAGERMLRDAVAVVDRAIQAHNRAALVLLATAHVAFRDGRAYHAQSRSSAAEESFRRAESLFVRAESPMANVARLLPRQRSLHSVACLRRVVHSLDARS